MRLKELKDDKAEKLKIYENELDEDDSDFDKLEDLKADIQHLNKAIKKEEKREQKIKDSLPDDPFNNDANNSSNDNSNFKSKEDMNDKIFNKAEKFHDDPNNTSIHVDDYMNAVFNKPKDSNEYDIIQNSVTSDGFELPERVSEQVIDKLREQNPLISKSGAKSALVEGDKQSWVKVKNNPKSHWHDELNKEDSDNSDIFDAVKMDPKTLMTVVEVSRETLQDSVNGGEAITTAMVGALNDKLIKSSFTSQGANAPKGLNDLVSQTETFSSGSVASMENMVKANRKLYDANVSEDNRTFLYSPEVYENISLETDSNGRYQMEPTTLRDIPKFTSSGVPTGEAYVMDGSNFVYGFSLNISIEKYNSSSVNKYGTKFLAVMRVDTAVTHPKAFVRIEEGK